MSVASKVVGKAILNRLKHVFDTQLEENQCGFRPKRACCDQIYVARMLIQKTREFNRPLYFCFIDLQKAYDSINREALWQSFRRFFSIPEKIICILQALRHNTTGIVRAEEQTSEVSNQCRSKTRRCSCPSSSQSLSGRSDTSCNEQAP